MCQRLTIASCYLASFCETVVESCNPICPVFMVIQLLAKICEITAKYNKHRKIEWVV